MPDMYSTASTLQGILARQKAEARQKLLDDAASQNMQSEMAARADQMKTSASNRQLATFKAGTENAEMGQDFSSAPPELQDALKAFGAVQTTPTGLHPQVTTSDQMTPQTGQPPTPEELDRMAAQAPQPDAAPAGKPGLYYKGNHDQQLQERQKMAFGGLISSGAFKDNPGMDQILALMTAGEDNKVPSQAYGALQPKGSAYVFDQDNGSVHAATTPDGKPISTGREGNQFLTHTRPPLPPTMQPFESHDKDGNPVLLGYDGRRNTYSRATAPTGIDDVHRVDTPGAGTGVINPSGPEISALRAAMNRIASDTAQFGQPKPETLAGVTMQQNQVIHKFSKSPKVAAALQEAISGKDPQGRPIIKTFTPKDLAARFARGSNPSPEELANYTELLPFFSGSF